MVKDSQQMAYQSSFYKSETKESKASTEKSLIDTRSIVGDEKEFEKILIACAMEDIKAEKKDSTKKNTNFHDLLNNLDTKIQERNPPNKANQERNPFSGGPLYRDPLLNQYNELKKTINDTELKKIDKNKVEKIMTAARKVVAITVKAIAIVLTLGTTIDRLAVSPQKIHAGSLRKSLETQITTSVRIPAKSPYFKDHIQSSSRS